MLAYSMVIGGLNSFLQLDSGLYIMVLYINNRWWITAYEVTYVAYVPLLGHATALRQF